MLGTPGVEVAGVAARARDRAVEFAARHDIPVFDGYRAIIDDPSIDAVYIPLPVGLHAQWALAALEAGKHVLCEKSLAASYGECAAILDAAAASDLVVVENFMCERHPQNEFVRDGIADGLIGTVHHISLSFGFPPFPPDDLRNSVELGGGALNDAGAYCLDMASFYLGAAPEAVTATLRGEPGGVDLVGAVLLEFANGTTAAASFGFEYDYRNEARFWGSSGQLDIDRSFSIPADRTPAVTLTRNTVRERLDIPAADQFALQVAYFRDLVARGDGSTELASRRRHAAVMEAVRTSAVENRRVRLDDDALLRAGGAPA
ncbi:Gfo/Idh/MocA family protein [Microbacterium sp. NPDC056569]|uniref:Gfo/Idh/MocA family protein n=1 Tax=Microbacterium sp. NPDC056569 TaxID=3345867 RepID=UPI00366B9E47